MEVATDDGPLHVVHAGIGPDVVLLHPGGLDLSVWDETAADLTRTHHVVRFDARSHGKSATAPHEHDRDPFFTQCDTEMALAIQDGDAQRWVNAMVRQSVDGPHRGPDHVDSAGRDRVRRLVEQAVRNHATATGQQLWHPVRQRLGEIAVPTLALVGELDSTPVNHTAELIEREVPGARRSTIPDVGHLPVLEALDRTLTEIRAHLA